MRQNPLHKVLIFSLCVVLLFILAGFGIYKKYFSGIAPVVFAPPEDITKYFPEDSIPKEAINETNFPLKLPPGFVISIFAKNLPGARVMLFDNFGNMWVSRTSEGAVSLLEIDRGTGKVVHQDDIFTGLRKPHGLAFDPENPFHLYIAEEHRVQRMTVYSEDSGETIISLPSGEGHFTRTIGFGPDKKLYISVGSSCNVCNEQDERRASIIQYDIQAKASKVFAKGLRNAVFFIWNNIWPESQNEIWTTEMGRDWLGDNIPPDEINIIKEDSLSKPFGVNNYGWPNCYGKNIHDTDFDPVRSQSPKATAVPLEAERTSNGVDKNTYIRNPCMEPFEMPSFIDIPAHSAPLGLAFIPKGGWPEDYWYDLLVAYHGSWNRSEPTGYKVVRHKFDANGNYQGVEDFISGWLVAEGALGRPVDILIKQDGTTFISDDKAGVIYKVVYQTEERQKLEKFDDKSNLIRVEKPKPNELIKSPFVIEGEARGYWFFEASFPVLLIDGNGKELFRGHADALKEWMVTDFVPFRTVLEFKVPETPSGTLILEKDNPSDLPENYDEIRIPVRFR